MSSEDLTMGGNTEADLKHRIERRVEIAEQAAKLKKTLSDYKAEDKSEGYEEKPIADAVKMRLADPEKVLATLLFEEKKKVYRKAAGVAVTIPEAERLAAAAAASEPEPKSKRKGKGKGEGKRGGGKGYN